MKLDICSWGLQGLSFCERPGEQLSGDDVSLVTILCLLIGSLAPGQHRVPEKLLGLNLGKTLVHWEETDGLWCTRRFYLDQRT